MRNKERINPILEKIANEWHKHPDYRFHQLLQALGIESTGDNFYVDDSSIMKVLKIKIPEFVEGPKFTFTAKEMKEMFKAAGLNETKPNKNRKSNGRSKR